MIIIDVDKFKLVNDQHGHGVGDRVLQHVADVLRRRVREVDVPGRLGGEEFLVICPKTDLRGATALAEKLRAGLEGSDFSVVGRKTASFGVATLIIGENFDRMVNRADAALYRAKEGGRNRVEVAASI